MDACGGKCEVWKFKSEWWKKLVEEVAVQSAAQHRQQASKHVSAGSRRIRHNFHRHQSQREGPAQSEEKAASYRAYRAGTGFAAWPGWTSAVVSERPIQADNTDIISCLSLSKDASLCYAVSGRTTTSQEEWASKIQEEASVSCLSLAKDDPIRDGASCRTKMIEEEQAC